MLDRCERILSRGKGFSSPGIEFSVAALNVQPADKISHSILRLRGRKNARIDPGKEVSRQGNKV